MSVPENLLFPNLCFSLLVSSLVSVELRMMKHSNRTVVAFIAYRPVTFPTGVRKSSEQTMTQFHVLLCVCLADLEIFMLFVACVYDDTDKKQKTSRSQKLVSYWLWPRKGGIFEKIWGKVLFSA